jgi:hypothetical protein
MSERIAEQPEHLLAVDLVLEPVLDRGDRAMLRVGGRDVAHAGVSQQRRA